MTNPNPTLSSDEIDDVEFETDLETQLRGELALANTGWTRMVRNVRLARRSIDDTRDSPPEPHTDADEYQELVSGQGHETLEALRRSYGVAELHLAGPELERARVVIERVAYRRMLELTRRLQRDAPLVYFNGWSSTLWPELGAYLQTVRALRGHTVDQQAAELDTTASCIEEIERGGGHNSSFTVMTDQAELTRVALPAVTARAVAWSIRPAELGLPPELGKRFAHFLSSDTSRAPTPTRPEPDTPQDQLGLLLRQGRHRLGLSSEAMAARLTEALGRPELSTAEWRLVELEKPSSETYLKYVNVYLASRLTELFHETLPPGELDKLAELLTRLGRAHDAAYSQRHPLPSGTSAAEAAAALELPLAIMKLRESTGKDGVKLAQQLNHSAPDSEPKIPPASLNALEERRVAFEYSDIALARRITAACRAEGNGSPLDERLYAEANAAINAEWGRIVRREIQLVVGRTRYKRRGNTNWSAETQGPEAANPDPPQSRQPAGVRYNDRDALYERFASNDRLEAARPILDVFIAAEEAALDAQQRAWLRAQIPEDVSAADREDRVEIALACFKARQLKGFSRDHVGAAVGIRAHWDLGRIEAGKIEPGDAPHVRQILDFCDAPERVRNGAKSALQHLETAQIAAKAAERRDRAQKGASGGPRAAASTPQVTTPTPPADTPTPHTRVAAATDTDPTNIATTDSSPTDSDATPPSPDTVPVDIDTAASSALLAELAEIGPGDDAQAAQWSAFGAIVSAARRRSGQIRNKLAAMLDTSPMAILGVESGLGFEAKFSDAAGETDLREVSKILLDWLERSSEGTQLDVATALQRHCPAVVQACRQLNAAQEISSSVSPSRPSRNSPFPPSGPVSHEPQRPAR